jgi:hypothetical protein
VGLIDGKTEGHKSRDTVPLKIALFAVYTVLVKSSLFLDIEYDQKNIFFSNGI